MTKPADGGGPAKPGQPAGATSAPRPAGVTATRLTIDDLRLVTGAEAAPQDPALAFLHAWFQLFKTAQIHHPDNQALRKPVHCFITVTESIVGREGRISFQSKDGALFMNSVKVRLSSEEYEIGYDTCEFLNERGIGGFIVDGPFTDEAVLKLLQILVYAPPERRKYPAIDAALREAELPLRINKTLGSRSGSRSEMVLERRSYTFLTYSKLVVLFRSVLTEEHLSGSRRLFLVKKIQRTVQSLVDICLEDDHTFLGVSSVKSGEAYAPHHAANCAVLAIALGEKIGLRKVDLADLGMAAMFHDIGLRFVSPRLLDKPGPLDPEERRQVDAHPMLAVEFLLGERTLGRSVLSQIVAAFEHHQGMDGSGHPRPTRRPGLYARIVAIADVFDALTSDRPWRKAMLPDEALALMLTGSPGRFDPALLKVFVNTVGLYPAGTLVRLSGGELAVVVYSGGEGERALRPIVALLDSQGKPGATLDLAERDAAGGYRGAIVSAENPAKYGLQASGLLARSPGV